MEAPFDRMKGYGIGQGIKKSMLQITLPMILRIILMFLLARVQIYDEIAPFGTAFYAATYLVGAPFLTCAFYILGLFSAQAGVAVIIRAVFSVAVFTLVTTIISPSVKKNKLCTPLVLLTAVLLSNAVTIMISGLSNFYIAMAAFEGVIAFMACITFQTAIGVLNDPVSIKRARDKEITAVIIVATAALCGLSNLLSVGPINLGISISTVICMVAALKYSPGTAAAAGVLVGITAGLSGYNLPAVVAVYALAGLAGGISSRFGRIGVAVSFVFVNTFMSFYNIGGLTILNLYDEVLAAIIFFLLPEKLMHIAASFSSEERHKKMATQWNERISRRLGVLSETFDSLSRVFTDLSSHEDGSAESSALIERTIDRVCRTCSRRKICWRGEVENNLKIFKDMLTTCNSKGGVDIGDVSVGFAKRCLDLETLLRAFNSFYETYRVDLLWGSRVEEGRAAMAGQMRSIAKLLGKLSETKDGLAVRDNGLEDKLYNSVKKQGVALKDVVAGYGIDGQMEISLELEPCGGNSQCDKAALRALGNACGTELERVGIKNCGKCKLNYREARTWRLELGGAQEAADGKYCGDSHSFVRLDDGRFIMALSDGMGTGIYAGHESKATVQLLTRLISAGFGSETAINLINSVLVNKSSEGPFATIDLAIFDLDNAKCSFLKSGAATSFVLHQNKKIELICTSNLPAGLIENMDIYNKVKTFKEGDMLIMLSDGALDADRNCVNKEERIVKLLSEFKGDRSQELADYLMNATKEICKGNLKDDTTILTAKCIKSSKSANNGYKGGSCDEK